MSFFPYRIRLTLKRQLGQWLGAITHVKTAQPLVALTFDDGPNPEATPELLRLFALHGAHATFFTLGSAAQQWPEITRQTIESGHAVGNHTWDHPSLLNIPTREIRRQLSRTEEVIGRGRPRLFRPPYGERGLDACLELWRRGYRTITWNANSDDWFQRDGARIRDYVASSIAPGNFYLFHDAIHVAEDAALGPPLEAEPNRDRSVMLETIAWMLETYSGRFRFVTVPELMAAGTPVKDLWVRRKRRLARAARGPVPAGG